MCVRCYSLVIINLKTNLPVSHQASHFYSRGKESTRFNPENVDTLCFACHRLWGGDKRDEYRQFKLKQLGEKRFNDLTLSSNLRCKKDRKAALLLARGLLKTLLK